jgi:Flp pilus assembly protein TadG
MSVEVILLTPVLVLFLLLVVAMGRAVAIRGEVEAATRDAVRAASYERDSDAALVAADAAVAAQLVDRDCTTVDLNWGAAGEVISVTVQCTVPWSDMALLGLPGSLTVESTSEAPLDLYRWSQ